MDDPQILMFLRLVEETTGWVLVTLESLWYNMVYYNIHEYTMVSSGILIVFVRLKKNEIPENLFNCLILLQTS